MLAESRAPAIRAALAAALWALAASPARACPWDEPGAQASPLAAGPGGWRAALEARLAAVPASIPIARAVAGDPAEVGQWLPPQPWPVIAIHAALLPDGKVLHYSYPDGTIGSNAQTWDPATGDFTPTSIEADLFCSGLSLLPDGRVFTTGGNDSAPCGFQGIFDTHVFDFRQGAWTRLGDMSEARWYPANVALADGSQLILSGLDRRCTTTPVMERYSPAGGLEVRPGGERFLSLFPRLHLLTSGEVAHVGPEPGAWIYDPVGDAWQFVDSTLGGDRYDGSSFRLPGASDTIVGCGGNRYGPGEPATKTCEKIDFSAATPQWEPTGPMNFGRAHFNPVLLPDGKVLVVGGGLAVDDDLYGNPVLNAELYDPQTESWTELPAQVHGRMYHSTAVLLPDGRVLSAGQDSGASGDFGEIYEPPYLFRGPRPTIVAAPAEVTYGEGFTVATPEASAIAAVTLIAPTTATHSVNTGQRHVALSFAVSGPGELAVSAPAGSTEAPPGFYLLFVVDGDGVPSVGSWLGLASQIFADGFETGSTVAWDAALP